MLMSLTDEPQLEYSVYSNMTFCLLFKDINIIIKLQIKNQINPILNNKQLNFKSSFVDYQHLIECRYIHNINNCRYINRFHGFDEHKSRMANLFCSQSLLSRLLSRASSSSLLLFPDGSDSGSRESSSDSSSSSDCN